MSPLIDLERVSLTYVSSVETTRALEDVSISVAEGELVAILGASGSGKTTLINVMAGLQTPDTGRVVVAGHEVGTLNARERAAARLHDIGVVFQDHNLIPEFTALENVALPLRAQGKGRQESDTSAAAALRAVGVDELGGRRPAQLSGGQRQRVGIARALCGGKRVLLTDEPTGSLDTANSNGVFRLLRELADSGVTVIVASHDRDVRDFSDRIVTMSDGRLAEAAFNELLRDEERAR